jgi:restriction system protein
LGELLRDKAWMFAAPFIVVTVVAALNSRYRRRLFDAQIGVESLRVISWQDFERLVGEAYRRQGYVVEEIGGSAPDGGVDLVLHRDGRKVVVQCKRWRSAQVGVTLVREFFGVIVAEKAERGIFVTSGTFTPDAVNFARGKPIELVDGRALAALIGGLQAGKPTPLPPSSPPCPKCGGEMARRLAKRGAHAGNEFWSCQRFPNCSGIRNISAEGS